MTATIKLKSKPLAGGVQHMYLVYTNEDGEERIIRGGPEGSDLKGALIGDVEVVNTVYDKNSIDWDKDGTHFSQTIFTGTDAEVQSKVESMNTEMRRINTEGYDYNLPIVETIIPAWADLNEQNSNTVVVSLARVAGLENEVKTAIFDNSLDVPGYLAHFEHSTFEKNTETLYEAIKDFNGSVSGFFSDAKESINDFKSDSKDFFSNLFGKEIEDQQSHIPQSEINNNLLNLTINTDQNQDFRPSSDPTQVGNAIDGGDYFIESDIDVLNGDGVQNTTPMGILTDQYRPGNSELSDQIDFVDRLSLNLDRLQGNQQDSYNHNQNPDQFDIPDFELFNPMAEIANQAANARSFLNIDPVILDLNGDNKIELISYQDSQVVFDVDNDNNKAEIFLCFN